MTDLHVAAAARAIRRCADASMVVLWTVGFLGAFRVIEDDVIYLRLIRRGIHLIR